MAEIVPTRTALPVPAPLPPQRVCDAADLVERGRAVVFDVLHFGAPARAFALRFDGRVFAYLNRCAHVPTELDWQPGEFLDGDREFIVCAIHGAAYEAHSGRCIGGPCGRGRLLAIDVVEQDHAVWWLPTRDTRPVFED
ncbi:MAG TPA: Rieske 2Fe-2S domain-containing protein [Caldimonas sp.]|jgi:nitrite reductase/ring-hydroxylating ferredoxin subunit